MTLLKDHVLASRYLTDSAFTSLSLPCKKASGLLLNPLKKAQRMPSITTAHRNENTENNQIPESSQVIVVT